MTDSAMTDSAMPDSAMTAFVVEADGGSRGNPGPAGYGAVVRRADTGELVAEVAASIGRATNNVAEYSGLIAGLRRAAELGATRVDVRMDSKLVVEQMSGRWQVKHVDLKPLAREAATLVRRIGVVRFRWVPRAENAHADRLANEAMDAAAAGRPWRPAVEGVDAAPAKPAQPAPATPRIPGWMAADHAPTTTLLLRHGETAFSVEKRFSGVTDAPLSERGRAQAVAAAGRLAALGGIDAVVSSPLSRARDTAGVVGAAVGLEVAVDDGLRETDFGAWEGLTFAEVQRRWPEALAEWLAAPDVAPPGGESFTATARRVRQARDRIVARYGGRRVLVVSHVTPIKTLVRIALDAPPIALYRLHLDLVGLSEIDWYADGPAVVRLLNDTSHVVGAAVSPPGS